MKNVFWCAVLWAVGLQICWGAPGDSVELAAGSSHPRDEGAGLLPALVWRLLLGNEHFWPALHKGRPEQVFSQRLAGVCSPKPCGWRAAATLGKDEAGGGTHGRNMHQGPSGWARPASRKGMVGAESTGRAGWVHSITLLACHLLWVFPHSCTMGVGQGGKTPQVGVSEFPMMLFIPQVYGDIYISSRSLSESKYFIVHYFPFYFSKIVFYNTDIFNFL